MPVADDVAVDREGFVYIAVFQMPEGSKPRTDVLVSDPSGSQVGRSGSARSRGGSPWKATRSAPWSIRCWARRWPSTCTRSRGRGRRARHGLRYGSSGPLAVATGERQEK